MIKGLKISSSEDHFLPGNRYVVSVRFLVRTCVWFMMLTGTGRTLCGSGSRITDGVSGSVQALATIPTIFNTGLDRAFTAGAD